MKLSSGLVHVGPLAHKALVCAMEHAGLARALEHQRSGIGLGGMDGIN